MSELWRQPQIVTSVVYSIAEVPMQTYEQLVDKVLDTVARSAVQHSRKLHHVKFMGHSTWPRDLKAIRENLLKFLEFCQQCDVRIGRPKVLRVHGPRRDRTFEHHGRYVKGNIVLRFGDLKVRVEDPDDVECFMLYTVNDHVFRKPVLPNILSKAYKVHDHEFMYARQCMPGIVKAFQREAGPHWDEVVRKVHAHWAEVEASLDRIVRDSVDKMWLKERSNFQKKLSSCLTKTTGLIDVPSETILAILKLGWNDIHIFEDFMMNNMSVYRFGSYVDMLELDDIVQAQNNARARQVMES